MINFWFEKFMAFTFLLSVILHQAVGYSFRFEKIEKKTTEIFFMNVN